MGVLAESRFAKHDDAAPNRWIADLERLPGGWPVLEKALHDRPILVRTSEAPGVFVDPVFRAPARTPSNVGAMAGAGRRDGGSIGYDSQSQGESALVRWAASGASGHVDERADRSGLNRGWVRLPVGRFGVDDRSYGGSRA